MPRVGEPGRPARVPPGRPPRLFRSCYRTRRDYVCLDVMLAKCPGFEEGRRRADVTGWFPSESRARFPGEVIANGLGMTLAVYVPVPLAVEVLDREDPAALAWLLDAMDRAGFVDGMLGCWDPPAVREE